MKNPLMQNSKFGLKKLISISLVFVFVSLALTLPHMSKSIVSLTNSWESLGEGRATVVSSPSAKIASVEYPTAIALGNYAQITVRARNDGEESRWQTIAVSFPSNPKDVSIVSNDLNVGAKIFWPGEQVYGGYGSKKVTLTYPLAEGDNEPWPNGQTHYMTVKVKPEASGDFRFYVKTVAGRQPDGVAVSWDPASGTKDQQDEYVGVYTISVTTAPIVGSFEVTVSRGGAKSVDVSVKNPNTVSITVTGFTVTDYGGFVGSISATNLPLSIPAQSTGYVKLSISAATNCPFNTYTIKFKLSGTP